MRSQTFGVEIEMTGITRKKAAGIIAEHLGGNNVDHGASYDAYLAKDGQGRVWKAVRDGSIRTQRKDGVYADSNYSTEVVTPILRYEDIETLQEIIRKLRKAGAVVNESCGIHIHIGADGFTAKKLRNLTNLMASKEDILFDALKIMPCRRRYCQKTDQRFLKKVNESRLSSMEEFEDIWYSQAPGESRRNHYNDSRYHMLNLHATFTKGTIEFRCFNSTLHAGKIKAYIQFCLAFAQKAKEIRSARPQKKETDNPKYTFRCFLLRLGLIGDEFKTCRLHMLANLEGNSAWRQAG